MRWPRLIGLAILVVLVLRLDVGPVVEPLRANWALVLMAFLLTVPMVLTKVTRWRVTLKCQGITYPPLQAALAYMASIYLGLVTPARAGEFVKSVYVSQDCGVTPGRALSSVLADRLFDLYALLAVGGGALLSLTTWGNESACWGLGLLAVGLTAPAVVVVWEPAFARAAAMLSRLGPRGQALVGPAGGLTDLRNGFRQLSMPCLLGALAMTVVAYGIFFGQCYLLSLAADLRTGPLQVSFAVALGSLVTLLPVSVSGLGTREAAVIAFLAIHGVQAEAALVFSLLVFVVFYVGGGVMGAVAWWIKPVALPRVGAGMSGAPHMPLSGTKGEAARMDNSVSVEICERGGTAADQ